MTVQSEASATILNRFSVPETRFKKHAGSEDVSRTFSLRISHKSNESKSSTLLESFVQSFKELEAYKNGKTVTVDGQNLSIPAVTAAARYHVPVALDNSTDIKAKIAASRQVISDKVDSGLSVYGVSTGFGGSADTRTDQPILLGHALLQHQHAGVLPSSQQPLNVLPLSDPLNCAMPESWVRGAILIRMNALIRGHSGVRWELIEKMNELLQANVTPLVPLRGTISASGDLSPLSYIAGTLVGNPSIRCFDGPPTFGGRKIVSSCEALAAHGIEPIPLASKEHLGILNGTAFSASVASLALNDAVHMALLTQIETAKNIWDLLEGSTFARTHEEEVTIDQDEGVLRQDRYPLRTAPQFIGPQVEDLLESLRIITIECNSTTDNPLADGETGTVHHGGNFQAMAVTNVMEKTRLSLHHMGKILFAQCAELIDPAMNRGLPPSLAATDPSLDYHCKGIDIGTAAYVAELGYLANPVSTHIQSAEMHNQAVNSLALISGRQTIAALETLSVLISSYLYAICQALDLRTMQSEFLSGLHKIASEEMDSSFSSFLQADEQIHLTSKVFKTMHDTHDATSNMDAQERMQKIASSSTIILLDYITGPAFENFEAAGSALSAIPAFRSRVAARANVLLDSLRRDYLSGERGPAPASKYLNRTKPVYEFVRKELGIRMHGSENYTRFVNGLGVEDVTIGQNISLIHEAIRDGKMQSVIVSLFSS
ncbi:Phenylalanine ammonia-lyase [Leucoagaricus sp. SymC.cos]|nr:Phenylalanine ammonia-lyase [Leucoagaricus sp. SymC.cos]